jgi:hypothetical protein
VAERNRWRSTAAHNVVMADGREQNQLSDSQPFRMVREAQVRVSSWNESEAGSSLEAEMVLLRGRDAAVHHRRSVRYDAAAHRFEVKDHLEADGEHSAEWRWHAAPQRLMDVREDQAQVGGAWMSWSANVPVEVRAESTKHARGYGDAVDAAMLVGRAGWRGSMEMMTVIEGRRVQHLRPMAESHVAGSHGS